MSETERMKAERAAKIALEEDRIKLEKEKEAGGGECAVLCCAVLCCAVLCCAVLCCAVLFLPSFLTYLLTC